MGGVGGEWGRVGESGGHWVKEQSGPLRSQCDNTSS